MKLSIVIAVLNSHEVVRRQALWFSKMNLANAEFIIVDDKSDPPLTDFPPFQIYRYEVPGKWTQPGARNFGAKRAQGEYLICTDIDHIISPRLIEFVMQSDYDFTKFRREVAVLDDKGEFVQTREAVEEYGYQGYDRRGFHISPHTNSFAIKRDLYLRLGGVSERYVGTGKYPNREELPLRSRLKALKRAGEIKTVEADEDNDIRPTIYMIPNGRFCGDKDYNPFGLFHSLSRTKPERSRMTNKEKRREGR